MNQLSLTHHAAAKSCVTAITGQSLPVPLLGQKWSSAARRWLCCRIENAGMQGVRGRALALLMQAVLCGVSQLRTKKENDAGSVR